MRLLKAEQLFRKVIEGRSKKKGRLLGLNVGSKYVGLAVSDDENKIALPLSVVGRTKTNISLMVDDFKTLVSKYSLVGFVVGYPFNLQGQACPDLSNLVLFLMGREVEDAAQLRRASKPALPLVK
ncbi:hypothetical protein ABZP36_025421 [Zizania latifolia]